jgi:hypothetical protein
MPPPDRKKKKKPKKKDKKGNGPLTGKSLRDRMRDGGDLAPMTGVATFGPGGTVTVTVAVAPATDRSNYKLYAASSSSTPSSSSNNQVASSANQPALNLLEGGGSFTPNQTLTVQLTFVRTTPSFTITVTMTGTVPAAECYSGNTSDPFTLT